MGASTGGKAVPIAFAVLLAVGLLAGGGFAQADGPDWSDDLFERLQDAAERYNDRVESDDTGYLGQWLLGNARINLYVTGPADSEAAFSFRTDDRLRVTQLQRGTYANPTLRIRTSREAVDRIADAEDKRAAINSEFWSGAIRVERIYSVFPGLLIAVGVREIAGVAAGGVLALAAVSKFGISGLVPEVGISRPAPKFDIGGALSYVGELIRAALAQLGRLGQSLWQNVGSIVSLITLLEKFELLSWMKERIRSSRDWLRSRAAGVLRLLRRSPSAPENPDDERKQ